MIAPVFIEDPSELVFDYAIPHELPFVSRKVPSEKSGVKTVTPETIKSYFGYARGLAD